MSLDRSCFIVAAASYIGPGGTQTSAAGSLIQALPLRQNACHFHKLRVYVEALSCDSVSWWDGDRAARCVPSRIGPTTAHDDPPALLGPLRRFHAAAEEPQSRLRNWRRIPVGRLADSSPVGLRRPQCWSSPGSSQLLWTALSAGPAAAIAGGRRPARDTLRTPVDISGIVNAHLFGIAPVPGELDPSAAPATQMSSVLAGTIAQTDPEKGLAIVGESAAAARVYAVGKTITGGARLHSVYPDRVILDRGGKPEALMLPRKFQGGGAPPTATMAAPMRNPEPMLGEQIRPWPPRTRGRSPRSSAAAGIRQRPAARLPRLSRPQPSAVLQARADAGRPRDRNKRHPAR